MIEDLIYDKSEVKSLLELLSSKNDYINKSLLELFNSKNDVGGVSFKMIMYMRNY